MARGDEEKDRLDIRSEAGMSRRDLLQRGAVVGGLVWVAPAIQSVTNPAFAQATPLERCFAIKWSREDGCEDANGTIFCITPPADQELGGCDQGVTFTDDTIWTATLPPGCELVRGCSKCAANPVLCNCVTTQTPNADGSTTVTFSPCAGASGLRDVSHIELIFCCE
jgi:hypothetical protein